MTDQNNTIPKGWKMTTLGNVAKSVEYGYTESASNKEIGPKFLRITDIQNDFIDWGNVPYCSISDKDFKKYRLNIGDVVVARTGNSTGATATIKDNIKAVFASYLIRFQINGGLADYIFIDFLLRSKLWKGFVGSVKSGSAQGGANAKDFSSFPIFLPPLPEQRAIARVLSSFDDKIELLREQNKTLEATAQAIFKEWFVKFNFPNDEGKPYKDSGSKMVDSELGEIPEGWRVGRLEKIIQIQNGYAFKSEDYVTSGVSIVRTTNFDNGSIVMNDVVYLTKEKAREYEKFYIEAYDFLLVMVGASIGKSVIVPSYILPALQNQNMWNFKPKMNNMKFYNILLLKKLVEQQLNSASGSARDFFRKDYFYSLEIIIPNNDLLVKSDHIMSKLYAKIDSNYIQIQTLSTLRDALLPKLMRGEVRVKF